MLFIPCYIESDQSDRLRVCLEKSSHVPVGNESKDFLINIELKFIANFYLHICFKDAHIDKELGLCSAHSSKDESSLLQMSLISQCMFCKNPSPTCILRI